MSGLEFENGETINTESDLTPATLIDTLAFHAGEIVMKSPESAMYAASVFKKAADIESLLTGKTGVVQGVITSWMGDVRPMLETIFDRNLEGVEIGALKEYTPTSLDGVYGRTRIVSIDEMFGPLIALDLAT